MALTTPLNHVHRELGARMVDFAGWDMPVQYKGGIAEHLAVREAAGLFDVSHMGEVLFEGPGALETVNRLISNDLTRIADGQALYSGLLTEAGTFVDDVVAYRFSPEKILVCVNASNREGDVAWMQAHAKGVAPRDVSDDWAQLALQGPRAQEILQRLTDVPLAEIGAFRFTEGDVSGSPCIISRTGYTGEDGFELYCAPDRAESLWRRLLDSGSSDGLVPCGLAARDTLRLEMRFLLYGNDIDREHTPLEAGLGWTVKLDKEGGFIGRDALAAQKARGPERRLVGFELLGPGIARQGCKVMVDGQPVGEVTSGTMGPSVKRAIGLAYVPPALHPEGSTFDIDVRGRAIPARVVKTPFYRRPAA
ncbi:MAG TPA: glycine cleavage system aminomethyltransferase GcvT [Myxococcaceae bacterium]|nr:glycine cleavage system aminomethyltransferase GcvT [Myxococcaceae bacterium]